MTNHSSVLPFYFNSAGKQLYGCYHPPRIEQRLDCGVVICQPMGHEYIYCHRALRQLAIRLAEVGFPVLRFDFYGCGDSSGDLEDAGLSQWRKDVSSAIQELQSRTNVRQVSLIGVRLGASLSLMSITEERSVRSIVLWDPVVVGKSYIEELLLLQKESLRLRPKSLWREKSNEEEVIGFSLSGVLRSEIDDLDLLSIATKPPTKTLTVQSDESNNYDSLNRHLLESGVQSDYQHIRAPKIWLPTVDGSLLVPTQILRSVTSWTCTSHA